MNNPASAPISPQLAAARRTQAHASTLLAEARRNLAAAEQTPVGATPDAQAAHLALCQSALDAAATYERGAAADLQLHERPTAASA